MQNAKKNINGWVTKYLEWFSTRYNSSIAPWVLNNLFITVHFYSVQRTYLEIQVHFYSVQRTYLEIQVHTCWKIHFIKYISNRSNRLHNKNNNHNNDNNNNDNKNKT